MTFREFEQILARHCSPVLLGVKPSNLVSFGKEQAPHLPELIGYYGGKLLDQGLSFKILCGCRKHYLVLVYREQLLRKHLSRPDSRQILLSDGYPGDASLEQMLDILKDRFSSSPDFPHEIGLFLGYPPEDVQGFRIHKGADCKLCGYWKVYGNVEAARNTFRIYDESRAYVDAQLAAGVSLLQILTAQEKMPAAS